VASCAFLVHEKRGGLKNRPSQLVVPAPADAQALQIERCGVEPQPEAQFNPDSCVPFPSNLLASSLSIVPFFSTSVL
jgi:hypothetical protein